MGLTYTGFGPPFTGMIQCTISQVTIPPVPTLTGWAVTLPPAFYTNITVNWANWAISKGWPLASVNKYAADAMEAVVAMYTPRTAVLPYPVVAQVFSFGGDTTLGLNLFAGDYIPSNADSVKLPNGYTFYFAEPDVTTNPPNLAYLNSLGLQPISALGYSDFPTVVTCTATIDRNTMVVTGTGTGINATMWRVVDPDTTVMDSGAGVSATFSFTGEFDTIYQLQFSDSTQWSSAGGFMTFASDPDIPPENWGEAEGWSSTGCAFSFTYVPPSLPTTANKTLLYATNLMEGRCGWFADRYTPGILVHYGEEGSSIHSILVGGTDGGVYQLTGPDDNGTAIACNIRTPSRDQGDIRFNKLYGDIMLDVNTQGADITATPGFNDHVTLSPAVTVNAATRTQVPIPVGTEWVTARNISLDISWLHSAATPEYIYTWEPRFTEDGAKVSAFSWETCFLTHDLHGYFYHGYLYLVHVSTANLTFSLIAEDGTTAASVTVPNSGGTLHAKSFVRLPVCKGKLFKYRLTSASEFRVEGQESELLVKPWGSAGPWERKRIFQDVPIGSAS